MHFQGRLRSWPAPGNGFLGAVSLPVSEKEVFLAARTSNGFSTCPKYTFLPAPTNAFFVVVKPVCRKFVGSPVKKDVIRKKRTITKFIWHKTRGRLEIYTNLPLSLSRPRPCSNPTLGLQASPSMSVAARPHPPSAAAHPRPLPWHRRAGMAPWHLIRFRATGGPSLRPCRRRPSLAVLHHAACRSRPGLSSPELAAGHANLRSTVREAPVRSISRQQFFSVFRIFFCRFPILEIFPKRNFGERKFFAQKKN